MGGTGGEILNGHGQRNRRIRIALCQSDLALTVKIGLMEPVKKVFILSSILRIRRFPAGAGIGVIDLPAQIHLFRLLHGDLQSRCVTFIPGR